jgi:hypothetical protein
VSGVIEESLGMLFQKNLELYNKIHIYNNGISLNISLPLEVADIVIRDYYDDYKISKVTNKPLKILIGAKILKSDNSHNFDLDPFSLIFPKHSYYISEDLCKRTFIDFTNNPDYYCNNGIMEKDIWFFEANIVKIGD